MISKLSLTAPLVVLLLCGSTFGDEVRGVIDRVDPANQEVVVRVRTRGLRGVALSFKVGKDTQVHAGNQPGELADLHPGARARVFYENRNGERVAVDIAVHVSIFARAEKAETPLPPPTPIADPNTVTGVLQRVALTDREIVVIGPGAKGEPELESILTVPEDARITKDAKPAKLEDLKEGERVVVRTEKRGDKMAAVAIQVGGPAAAAPKSPPNDKIERLRQVLRLADYFLQQLAEGKGLPR